MSFISAVLNNQVLVKNAKVRKYPWYRPCVEGSFVWNLPANIPALMNNNWGVRVVRSSMTSRIANVDEQDIVKCEEDGEPSKMQIFHINQYTPYVDNASELVVLLNDILVAGHAGTIKIEGEKITLNVDLKSRFSIGVRICRALNLINSYTEPNGAARECHFTSGKYETICSIEQFDSVFKNDRGPVYLLMDCVQGSIVGDRFLNFVHSMKPGETENYSVVYHDLSQSPLRSSKITFVNGKLDPILFCPNEPDDFLFNIELQFKRMSQFM